MEQHKNEKVSNSQGHTYWQWIASILASMPVLVYGMEYGWISSMTKILQSEQSPTGEPISDIILSWIASVMNLSAVFSIPMFTYIVDRLGRRTSIIIVTIPQAISWLMRLIFTSSTSLIIARIVSGISIGGCFSCINVYIKEISQDNNRGILASLQILFQNIGIFIMYIMGMYLDYYTILWISVVIPIATGILFYKAPESPAFLIKSGKIQEAIKTIAFLRGRHIDDKIVMDEIILIRNEEDYFKSQPTISLVDVVKNPIWRRGIIVLTVMSTIRGLNGAFAVTTYPSTILTLTGVKFSFSPETLTLSIPAVMICGSVFSMLSIERFGRKTLFITMLVLSACSLLSIGFSIVLQQHGAIIPSWLPVLCMMVVAWGLSAGVALIPVCVISEMFNFQIRARVLAVCGLFGWLLIFIPVLGFIPLSNVLGLHTTLFIFAGVNIFGAIYSAIYQPETRGKSVDEIEKDIASRIGLVKTNKNDT